MAIGTVLEDRKETTFARELGIGGRSKDRAGVAELHLLEAEKMWAMELRVAQLQPAMRLYAEVEAEEEGGDDA